MKKILLFITCFCTMLLCAFIIINKKTKLNYYIYSLNESRILTLDNKTRLDYSFYFENKNTTLNNKKRIKTVQLVNKLETTLINLELASIKEKEELLYQNKKLIKYEYEFFYNSSTPIKIDLAYLKLKSDIEEVKLFIGSINLIKKTKEASVFGLYGITNSYNNTEYLAAVAIKLNEKYKYIKDIKSLDSDYVFDLKNSKILLEDNFDYNLNLNYLFDDYNLFDANINNTTINNTNNYLLIPIKYHNFKYLSKINYELILDDETYQMINFNYFKINEISLMKEYIIINDVSYT